MEKQQEPWWFLLFIFNLLKQACSSKLEMSTNIITLLSYLCIKKFVEHCIITPTQSTPVALSRLLGWVQARGKRVLEGNTCGSAWAYAFACKTNHVWANLCGSWHMCVTEMLPSTNEFGCHWLESGSVHWVWCLVCCPCVVWSQSLVVNEELQLVCFAVFAPFFLLSPLKNKTRVFFLFTMSFPFPF